MNILGVDIGNDAVKTVTDVFTAGIITHPQMPKNMISDYIGYKGKCYTIAAESRSYTQDKTTSDDMFIQVLFSALKAHEKKVINLNRPVSLATGLPPRDGAEVFKKYEQYFCDHIGDGATFYTKDKQYTLNLGSQHMYVQDWAAVQAYRPRNTRVVSKGYPNRIIAKYDSFVAIDIGGMTVEFMLFREGKLAKYDSVLMGINKMVDHIRQRLNTHLAVDRSNIIDILRGKETILAEQVTLEVKALSADWAQDILKSIHQFGIELRSYPTVFFGGGSLLLHDYLLDETLINTKHISFVKDVRANAIGYDYLARLELERGVR